MPEINFDYKPRPPFVPFHTRTQRWSVVIAHRRAGKTVACLMDALDHALRCKHSNGRFAYIAPYYVQAKSVAWDYLKSFARPVLAGPPNESELRVDLINGARISLYGGDNFDRLRGLALDGVILDEFADMPPKLWGEVIRPALADRKGWATIIGTVKGKNQLWQAYEAAQTDPGNWFSAVLRASETGILDPQELADAKRAMSVDQYAAEFECDPTAAIQGAYYADALKRVREDERIGKVPYERGLAVHTAWDLGVSDSTAIWFIQVVGREVRVIDYHEDSGCGLDEYAKVLKDKGYVYGTHYFPHDIAVRELSTGKSRLETLRNLGLTEVQVVPQHNVNDGINAVRRLLDRCWFDEQKTKRGVECLWQYRRDWDERGKVWRNNPLHDWTSHGSDAMRTFAAGWAEPEIRERKDRWSDYGRRSSDNSWMIA